jgi:heme A synthase
VVHAVGGPPRDPFQELTRDARCRDRGPRGRSGGILTTLLTVHSGLFRAGLIITGFIAIWSAVLYLRRQAPSGSFRATLVLTEGLFVVQGLVGIAMYFGGSRPHDQLHWLYGPLLVITLPIAASYLSGRESRREALVYGLAALFMFGLAIRAYMTGHV